VSQLLSFLGGGTFVVFLAIIIVVLLIAYLSTRYKVAGANEALIRSGRATPLGGGEAGLKVVRGQGIVVLPLFHKIGKLKLTARQINVNLADAVSRQGIKVAVQGVATFKIGADDESIRNAAERFLDAQEEQVDSIVKNVLEGSLRSIVGTLTIEELNLDRQKFQQAVQDAAKGDLATSGLLIDSFTIQAIRDESGYMELIGQQETARRERDARMAKATADQEAAVREAEAEQIKINAQRDVSLRKAETDTQIAAAEARAAQAGPLAQAEATQEVTRKQTELAQLEADRKQKELIASTIRPAEADAEAQIRRAEGEKGARIAQAQADAERVKLAGQAEAAITITKGEANARVILVNAQSQAEKTKLEGGAEAGIVFTKGEAEAKALELRAEA
jgi:flotillin